MLASNSSKNAATATSSRPTPWDSNCNVLRMHPAGDLPGDDLAYFAHLIPDECIRLDERDEVAVRLRVPGRIQRLLRTAARAVVAVMTISASFTEDSARWRGFDRDPKSGPPLSPRTLGGGADHDRRRGYVRYPARYGPLQACFGMPTRPYTSN